MRIYIIRHAEPIYDPEPSLTEKGFEEAKALGEYYKNLKYDEVYTSPYIRAKLTCDYLLGERKDDAIISPWLKEFDHPVIVPYEKERVQNWDFAPDYFASNKNLYDKDKYLDDEMMKSGNMKEEYIKVINEFEKVLNKHNYFKKDGYFYTPKGNHDVLVFVCHFGMMGVLLSHLLNIPFCVINQHFCCAPTGVTILNTEERKEGIAQFRVWRYGDVTHLLIKNQEPSFHARFCEVFSDDTRH